VTLQWDAVDRLLDTLGPELVSQHGLGPLGARRLRKLGKPVPEQLFREDRAAATANLIAPALLARVREAYDGPLLLLKGPELTGRYPDRARRFGDIDVLAGDAEAAQAALLASGFRLQERNWPPLDWQFHGRPHYHLQPLEWPDLGLRVEVHREVKWPLGLEPPPNEALFEAAVPSSVNIDGLVAPHPDHHAVLLAAHAWAEVPMHKLRDLIDVMVFVDDARRDELARIARAWRFDRPWRSSLAVADWLFDGGPEPRVVRVWARYLRHLREPTVVELHLQAWLSPFWLAPPPVALRQAAAALARDFRARPNQSWAEKRRQTLRALVHPFSPKSAHDRRSGRRRRNPSSRV